MITIEDALTSLTPGSEWVVRGDKIEWLDKIQTQPTDAEIQAEITRLQTEYDKNKYQRDRKAEYPSTGDQLDYIFHHGVEKWKEDMIVPVKNKHPKE